MGSPRKAKKVAGFIATLLLQVSLHYTSQHSHKVGQQAASSFDGYGEHETLPPG